MSVNKGIILAGGSGSRLYPVTVSTSKQLLPIADKPMVYYPLSTLMQMGIRDLLLISTPHDLPRFEELLGDGSRLGVSITYAEQPRPEGIAQALIIGEQFINGDSVALMLGDNLFYGAVDFTDVARSFESGCTLLAKHIINAERYGVITFDKDSQPVSIIEKPKTPASSWAVTGLYLYDAECVEMAKQLKPSKRGEIEITDVNQTYLEQGKCRVIKMGTGAAWLDTGTTESINEASEMISTIEKRHGERIGCIEETALRCGYISKAQFESLIEEMPTCAYRAYLESVLAEL